MAAVSEWIAREYFEAHGFLVQQPTKYQVAARAKRAEEECDLLVFNPGVAHHRLPDRMIWGAADLKHIARAIIGVRGWHTDRFSPALLKDSPEIFRFAGEDVLEQARNTLGKGNVAKVLCLPGLAATHWRTLGSH